MTAKTAEFWDSKYLEGLTGWDIGYASPALMKYCMGQAKDTRILIPGAGNSYEWIALKESEFKDVTVLDISEIPLAKLRVKYPLWADDLIHMDFFGYNGQYDLILEQTFFCALDPALREDYMHKMKSLLKPGGKLVGLLFNREFEKAGPPFGGTLKEYQELFHSQFEYVEFSPSTESIPERAGSELFFIASNH